MMYNIDFPSHILNCKYISFLGAIPPLGAFFGSIFSGPLMHFLGRKWTVLITSPIAATAWGLIATAQQWQLLVTGRVLSGMCAGICLPSAQIYVCMPNLFNILNIL